jgi:hypothetical protein
MKFIIAVVISILFVGCNADNKLKGLERPIVIIAIDSSNGTVVLQSEGMTVVTEVNTYFSLSVIASGFKVGDTLMHSGSINQ